MELTEILTVLFTAILGSVVTIIGLLPKWLDARVVQKTKESEEVHERNMVNLISENKKQLLEQMSENEKKIKELEHRYRAQERIVNMLLDEHKEIQKLVISPARIVRNLLRSIYNGEYEGDLNDAKQTIIDNAGVLKNTLENFNTKLMKFDIDRSSHTVKKHVNNIKKYIERGELNLEKGNPELKERYDKLTEYIEAVESTIKTLFHESPESQ